MKPSSRCKFNRASKTTASRVASAQNKFSEVAATASARSTPEDKGQQPRTPDELRGLPERKIFEEDAQLESAFEVLREEQHPVSGQR